MPPRVQKARVYVDVIARWADDGRISPLAVCWPDGRTFFLDAVGRAPVSASALSAQSDIVTYSAKSNGKPVTLYMEKQGPQSKTLARWFVLVEEGRPLWKFNL